MSQEIRYFIDEKRLDENDNITLSQEFQLFADFDDQICWRSDDFPSGGGDTAINLGEITTGKAFRIVSDQDIGIIINGNSAIVGKGIVFSGLFTSLAINNSSGNVAKIDIYAYGS